MRKGEESLMDIKADLVTAFYLTKSPEDAATHQDAMLFVGAPAPLPSLHSLLTTYFATTNVHGLYHILDNRYDAPSLDVLRPEDRVQVQALLDMPKDYPFEIFLARLIKQETGPVGPPRHDEWDFDEDEFDEDGEFIGEEDEEMETIEASIMNLQG